MAKMLAYYSLCPINDVREFLGLSRDVNAGCVINTLGRNIVQVVKLSNQKLLHSWTALDRLTSKVVYDFRSERYVGVFGGRHVRCWSADQADINKAKKVKVFREIRELFSVDNGQVLVLYDDGTCESLESAVVTRNEDRRDPENIVRRPNVDSAKEEILEVSTAVLKNGEVMLMYFVKTLDGSVELNYCLLEKESLKPAKKFQKVRLERVEQKVQLVGQSIVEGAGCPALVTIWSDKRMFIKPLSFDDEYVREEQPQSIGNFISILNMINASQPLSVIGISQDYIAVYANNLNQEGATLFLYNVSFKVIQAKQFFKVYFSNSRFWLSENNLLLAFGQTLAVVPFKISKEQLSDMVGTQKSFELGHYVDNESINEDCDFNEGYAFVGDIKGDVEGKDAVVHEDQKVFEVFESIEKFEQLLNDVYRSDMQVDVIRDKTLPDDMVQMRLMSNIDKSIGPLIFSSSFEMLASELEKHGFPEIEITDKLLPLMIQAGASLDIGKCLKRYSTVSERALVSALKYVLACPDRGTTHKLNTPKIGELLAKYPETETPLQSAPEEQPNLHILDAPDSTKQPLDLLNILLSCTFNRPSLLFLLRNELDLNATLTLLDHLLHLLTDPIAHLNEPPATAGSDNFDSDEKVIDWATALIDSHYQQIVLSSDGRVREKLSTWIAVLKQHAASLAELNGLAPTIRRLVAGGGTSERRLNEWYSVETVQLY